jgi:hypothetical protein
MGIYCDKHALELAIGEKMVAKLSQDNGVPNDEVVEFACQRADVMILSKLVQFYKGPHPIVAPGGNALLKHVGVLYSEAYLQSRDPSFARTYVDTRKNPKWMEAEAIMVSLQTNSRCLYDNAAEPYLSGGRVAPANPSSPCVPQLFGDNYMGDLLCLYLEYNFLQVWKNR